MDGSSFLCKFTLHDFERKNIVGKGETFHKGHHTNLIDSKGKGSKGKGKGSKGRSKSFKEVPKIDFFLIIQVINGSRNRLYMQSMTIWSIQ